MPEAMKNPELSFAPAAGERLGGGEKFLEILPEIVVPVEERESSLASVPDLVLDLAVGEEQEETFNRLAVERKAAGGELVLHRAILPVRGEGSVLGGQRLLQLVEAGLHLIGRGRRIPVIDGDLEEAAGVETTFDRVGGRGGEIAGLGRNTQDPKRGLISRERNVNVQGMSGSPINQLFRGISPTEAEGRFQQGLGAQGARPEEEPKDACRQTPDEVKHVPRIGFFRHSRKPGRRSGTVLLEATMAMAMLSAVGLALLKLSLNVTTPRQWTLQQSITDAYLTFEKASAQRQPFEAVSGPDSLWPLAPAVATTTVTFGRLPGGAPITGTVTRTRFAGTINTAASIDNPASMEVWRLQSVVRYTVGSRSYMKSRTVVRTQ